MEQPAPLVQGRAVLLLDLLEDLDHIEGQERRLLSDHHGGEERVRGALDENL